MHRKDLSTLTKKHMELSQGFMSRHKEIADLYVANDVLNSFPNWPPPPGK